MFAALSQSVTQSNCHRISLNQPYIRIGSAGLEIVHLFQELVTNNFECRVEMDGQEKRQKRFLIYFFLNFGQELCSLGDLAQE